MLSWSDISHDRELKIGIEFNRDMNFFWSNLQIDQLRLLAHHTTPD
jgi:hypothetical protein